MLQKGGGDLGGTVGRIVALSETPVASASELTATLRKSYQAVHEIDLGKQDAGTVRSAAPAILAQVFAARMTLRDRIADWRAKGFLDRESETALRDLFRISRYGEDMLGEVGIGNVRLGKDERSRRAFTGQNYNTRIHPKFDTGRDLAFRSGDVLLMRGTAHNSAAIARIGDVDSQFSHIAIIYVDPSHKHWVVEALIEDGAVITPLDHVLEHGLGRAVLYRHKDADLAARAAEIIHARVLATKTGDAPHIPYDFSMKLKGRKKLFCAKLVHQAYLDASGGKVNLPLFKTRFDKRNAYFYKTIGMTAKETFAPGDIDIDPAFDLVAEWQDYRATPRLRQQDMIMTKFFEWMETRGYRFREDFFVRLIAIFGRLSSYLSDGAKELISSVVPKVPSNMSRRCIATIVMLHKTAEGVMPAIAALDENHARMTGAPLHPLAILDHLERLRETSGGKIGYLRGKA